MVCSAGGSDTNVAYPVLIEDAGTHWLCGMLHVVKVLRHYTCDKTCTQVQLIYQTHFCPAAHLLLAFSTVCCSLSHFSKTAI